MRMAPNPKIKAPPMPSAQVPVTDPAVCSVTGVGVGPRATAVVGVGVAPAQVQLVESVH